MKGSINIPPTTHYRTEIFSQNAVSIFADDASFAETHPKSLQFARQIAAVKNVNSSYDQFYVMDIPKVYELIDQWTHSLPRVHPYYSVDCNNDPVLLKLLANAGLFGFTCRTSQSLHEALQYMPADRVFYSNALWTRASLKEAAVKEIQHLTFESSRDLDRIMLHHPNAELLLHICVNDESDDPSVLMGCDAEAAPELMQYAISAGANVVGVSFNLGNGVRPALYTSAIEIASKLYGIGTALGVKMHMLNLGCGFSHTDQHFSETCAYINDSLNYFFPSDSYPHLQIIATPGRFFASSAFSLVTNITGRRSVDLSDITNDDFDSGHEAFVYQTNEGYYGSFGCRVNAIEPECTPLFDHYMDNFSAEHVYGSVIGPTIDDNDVIQSLCRFRPLETGDWLVWKNMGAYSMNNRGNLGDEDDYRTPMVFYFTSQSQWERIDDKLYMESSLPTTPIASDYGSDDDALGSFTMESIVDNDVYDDFLSDEQDKDYEEKFLAMFGWPLHE